MQVDAQAFLDLVENHKNGIVFFDIESTGFNADYNSVIVFSWKPYNRKANTIKIVQLGNDKKVVREAKQILESFHCWVSFFGKGFDIPFLNSRLIKWGYDPVQPKHHLDLFFTLKAHMKLSSNSLAQYAGFLRLENQKMGIGPNVWSEVGFKGNENLKLLTERCESDCTVLHDLYERTKHIVREIKK